MSTGKRDTARRERMTVESLARLKAAGEPVVMVTAYDYPSAQIADEVGVDVVLVGDSAANVVLGYDSTVPVTVVDINNGARFETYTIAGRRGSGDLKINGAAARLVHTGDIVILISYGQYSPDELASYLPRVVHVDSANRILAVDADTTAQPNH